MHLTKGYSCIFSFFFLHYLFSKTKCVDAQTGERSRRQCFLYKWIGFDTIFFPAIAGGTRANEYEYPHMAALGYGDKENRKWKCGGSLISSIYILTAAHCLRSRQEGNVKIVRLGTKNIINPSLEFQDYEISERIRHPQYKPPRRYNDIGLLRLQRRVTFTRNIKPACLQTNWNYDVSSLSAAGWGDQGTGEPSSPDLLKIDLILYNYTTCSGFYENLGKELPNGIEPNSMICAGGRKDEVRDTCSGDSGGPLQMFTDLQYYIVGVTSFGRTCGLANVPAIYTRVSNYIEWIENIVWNQWDDIFFL